MDVRRTLCVLSALAALGWGVKASWADPSCTSPARRCAPTCKQPCPERPICIKVPHQIEMTPESFPENIPENAPGGFAAPPRTGTAVGESTTLGIEGGEIRIPALSLRLPTVRLPSLRKYRRDAHMEIDATEAAYVNNFREEFSFDAGRESRPENLEVPPPRPRPESSSCTQAAGESVEQKCAALQAELNRVRSEMAKLQGGQGACPNGVCPTAKPQRNPPVPDETIPAPVAEPPQRPYTAQPRPTQQYGYYAPPAQEVEYVEYVAAPEIEQRMERLELMIGVMYDEMRQQRLAAAAQEEANARPVQFTDAPRMQTSRLRLASHEPELRRLPPAESFDDVR